jgi:hypothetical protein
MNLSENSFKHKDGKDSIGGIRKGHRMAIPSYEIDSKELIRFYKGKANRSVLFTFSVK